ncbi:MAG: sigma-70 family RNA polymerase sigma factor [Deltaproteobacteria bacterium]
MRGVAELKRDERAIVVAALDGDTEAMRQLVSIVRPVIQAEVAWTLRDRAPIGRGRDPKQEVQDLVQDVFIALLEKDGHRLRAWDPQRGRTLASFVKLLARRRVTDALRSRPRSPWTEEPAGLEDIGEGATPSHADHVAARIAVQRVVSKLRETMSERSTEIFSALYLEEATVEEVCESHDLSRDALYAWRARFKRSVRRLSMLWDAE